MKMMRCSGESVSIRCLRRGVPASLAVLLQHSMITTITINNNNSNNNNNNDDDNNNNNNMNALKHHCHHQ